MEVFEAAHASGRAGNSLSADVSHRRGRGPIRERPHRVHQVQVRRVRRLCFTGERSASTRASSGKQAEADARAVHAVLHAGLAESAAARAPKRRHLAHSGRRGPYSPQEKSLQGPSRDDARHLRVSRVSEWLRLLEGARLLGTQAVRQNRV